MHLVTAHRSKGLEYEYVYIIHARDAHWGNRTARDKLPLSTLAVVPDTDVEDERRLFYVALTRAKLSVSVSYGITSTSRTKESGITQYMLEIDSRLIAQIDTIAFENSVAPQDIFALRPQGIESLSDKEYLRDAFTEQGLSATALNNYLECPWKYFYRNLVRVPEKPTSSSLYGNALHNALRLFRDLSSSTQTYQSLATLLEYLKISIDQQGFTPASYDDAFKKGVRALSDWHERNKKSYEFNTMCEKKFEVYYRSDMTDPSQILLRGLIDVIEFRTDGMLHVIDYKTGKHKSRKELLGETKSASGDYKRQLDFYCILLELSQMQTPSLLTLEFIEPDASNNSVTHDFDYDDTAVKELKSTIERVSNEIYSLTFWDKQCETPDCEYCALRELTRK